MKLQMKQNFYLIKQIEMIEYIDSKLGREFNYCPIYPCKIKIKMMQISFKN